MRYACTLSLLAVGWVLNIAINEAIDAKHAYSYTDCINKEALIEDELSPYQRCRDLLKYNRLEEVILWRPNLWCGFDSLRCGDLK